MNYKLSAKGAAKAAWRALEGTVWWAVQGASWWPEPEAALEAFAVARAVWEPVRDGPPHPNLDLFLSELRQYRTGAT